MRRRGNYNGSGQALRRGAVAVELAVMALPFFMTVFVSVEFGRALLAGHTMEEAARAGVRRAVLDGTTKAEVETVVADLMAPANITNYTVKITKNFGALPNHAPVTVDLEAHYGGLSWMPLPNWISVVKLKASATQPRETEAAP